MKMILSNQKPFIAGNWKLHKTNTEASNLVRAILEEVNDISEDEAEMAVMPPFTALSPVAKILQNSRIHLGAQNLYWEDEGAFTGEISAPMLKDAGCRFVVVGHSERRQYFGETNQTVNKKIQSALSHQLIPVMCIGETLEERENNQTSQKVESQITEGLDRITAGEIKNIIIAYEPIWAIGTGRTATPEQAGEVHDFIREKLTEKYGKDPGDYVIILYGGSVKPENAYSLIKEKNVNGALIGGASLQAGSFAEITEEAIKAYKKK
jgi:triosephosphate isomerase (TIM)